MALSMTNIVYGNVTNDYGLDNVPYTIGTTGPTTCLLAYVGWDIAQEPYQATGKSPAVNVTDSAGNLWRQIGISTVCTQTRGALWIADNPRQVSWVSVALTGWGNSTAYQIMEMDNTPGSMGAISLDFVNTVNNTAFTTGLTLNGSASTSDIVFGLVTTGGNGGALTVPTGWTGIGSSFAGGNFATDATTYAMWIPGTVGTLPAFSPTWANSVPSTGIIVGLKETSTAPTQTNPNMPNITVEAAFGADPGDYTQSVDYTWDVTGLTWTDISSRAFSKGEEGQAKTKRGRQYELSQEETGETGIMLDNHDGALTYGNIGSQYYSTALNANMSFQNSMSPWTAINAATVVQATSPTFASGYQPFVTAAFSAKLTCGSSATPGIESEYIAITPGFQYSYSAWFYSATGYATGAQVGVNWYTSSKTYISSGGFSVTALPAGVWTQSVVTAQTPPANAAFVNLVAQLDGTPGSGVVFNIAEAAFYQGTLRTGLTLPGTPIRITAWWNGTQYPIGYGYVETWPQAWPEMPQWGFSEVAAVDAWGPLASATLPSALEGEVIKEGPYFYFPTAEQYEFTSQSLTPTAAPIDANGLIAVNYAYGNNRYGAYRDGFDQPVTVGQALNLLGDENTCLGATTYAGQEFEDNGPGMFYFDPNIPTNFNNQGMSIEFWFVWGNTNTYSCQMMSAFGRPSSFYAAAPETTATNGGVISVGINTGLPSSSTVISGFYVNGVELTNNQFNQTTFAPQHFLLTTGPNGTTTYLNGVTTATNPVIGVIPQIKAAVLGPARFSYDVSNLIVYNGYNFISGHFAWYPVELTSVQAIDHYTAGISGWSGVSAAGRYAQTLTWGRLGMKRGGTAWYTTYGQLEGTYMSEAYAYQGSSAADVMNQLVQTEHGRCYTQANGSIVYVYRWYLYNQPTIATFTDNITSLNSVGNYPYEQGTSFAVDNQFIYNQVQATQNRGPDQDFFVQNTDFTSYTEYFLRSGLQVQSYSLLPFDVFDVVNWDLQKYKQPTERVIQLELDVTRSAAKFPSLFPVILGLELNQTIVISRTPIGGATITVTGTVQSIEHDIGATYWKTVLQVTPAFPENTTLFADISGQNTPNTQYLSW
jgi:hypothetical protein